MLIKQITGLLTPHGCSTKTGIMLAISSHTCNNNIFLKFVTNHKLNGLSI